MIDFLFLFGDEFLGIPSELGGVVESSSARISNKSSSDEYCCGFAFSTEVQ